MIRDRVVELLELLGAERIRPRDEWVNCACLFAPWYHAKGTDTRPSFGVSVGKQSHYFCFSCHRSGPLPALVTALCMLKGKDDLEAREFVMQHEDLSLEPFEDLEKSVEPLSVLSPELVKKFCPAHPGLEIIKKRGIEEQTIQTLDLRWDVKEGRLIFPVFNAKKQLVGFRGRALKDDKLKIREYSEFQPQRQSLKGHGIWYGMHRKPEKPEQKIILVEGEMDAVSLMQALAQRPGVWAAMGSSLSAEQIRVVQSLRNPVLLFFDNDEAGVDATRKIMSKLAYVKAGIFKVTDYRGRKDPDEIVRARQLRYALESIQQIG